MPQGFWVASKTNKNGCGQALQTAKTLTWPQSRPQSPPSLFRRWSSHACQCGRSIARRPAGGASARYGARSQSLAAAALQAPSFQSRPARAPPAVATACESQRCGSDNLARLGRSLSRGRGGPRERAVGNPRGGGGSRREGAVSVLPSGCEEPHTGACTVS